MDIFDRSALCARRALGQQTNMDCLNNKEIHIINNFIQECTSLMDINVLCVSTNSLYKLDNNFSHKINQNIASSCQYKIMPFFNKGVYLEIDLINEKINNELLTIKCVEEIISSNVKLDYSLSMGYHFLSTVGQARARQEQIRKIKHELDDIIIKENKSCTRITHDMIEKSNVKISSLLDDLKDLIKTKFISFTEKMLNQYEHVLTRIINFVANVDVIQSNYKLSSFYKYCRPICIDTSFGKSYFKAKNLRNALLEQIHKETKYVPNDVNIGIDDCEGIIVYSVNACGKTSLIKACGISILLAQMGSFVPSSYYEFSPYNKIMTRIKNDDHIGSGKSSFVSEMTELRSVLNTADNNTLVLADEITRGTEHVSGSSIFAASVIILARRKVNFMFTTHLHDIYSFISDLKNVKIFHLTVIVDENGKITFERKLKEGTGESIYGLEICRYLNMDPEFLDIAFDIRASLIDKNKAQIKKSRYNSSKIITKCEICGYVPTIPLDTHHIKPKKDYLCPNSTFDMNANFNLVALCKECHRKVHKKEITVNGFISTSEGIILDYE
jgi:DNA mismatch repair protein MutS